MSGSISFSNGREVRNRMEGSKSFGSHPWDEVLNTERLTTQKKCKPAAVIPSVGNARPTYTHLKVKLRPLFPPSSPPLPRKLNFPFSFSSAETETLSYQREEFPVSKTTPSLVDLALVKTWTERKCLMRLRTNAIDGNIEWVKLLLRATGYKTYPMMLTRNWWVRDASPSENHKRIKTAVSVMRRLLDSIAIDELPKDVAKDIPSRAVDKNQALLKLWPRVKAKFKAVN